MEAHGNIEIIWRGTTLCVTLSEEFNAEGAMKIEKLIKESVKQSSNSAWRRFIRMSHTAIGCPALIKMIKHMQGWYKESGCIGGAIVVSNKMQKDLYSTNNENVKTFYCAEEAWVWLDNQAKCNYYHR